MDFNRGQDIIENDLIDNSEVYWTELMKEIATWEDVEEYDE